MIWISLILSILQALPQIIDLIKEIIDLIHGHPFQIKYQLQLHTILSDWDQHRDTHRVQADLHSLKAAIQP